MTKSETWTEILKFCQFLFKTEDRLFFALKCGQFCP